MRTDEQIREELDHLVTEPPIYTNGHAKEGHRPALIWADEIALDVDADVGLIDGFYPMLGLAVLYGESGCGKTFVALDQACHIAAGLPWRGMPVEQGIVVYVAAENPTSVKRRVWTWKNRHQIDSLPLLIVQSSVDLLNGSTAELIEVVTKLRLTHGRIAMVVLDTLARAMVGNENAAEDMSAVVSAMGRICEAAEAFGMVVHHSGKDTAKGARGWSGLRAAVDVEIEVTKGSIHNRKFRDEKDGDRIGFKLERIVLGTNRKGREISTCIVIEAEPPEPKAADDRPIISARQKIVLDCLATAIVDHGEVPPPSLDIHGSVRVVTFTKWRDVALRYMVGEKDARRQREDFKRCVEALQSKHLVNCAADWCWPGKRS